MSLPPLHLPHPTGGDNLLPSSYADHFRRDTANYRIRLDVPVDQTVRANNCIPPDPHTVGYRTICPDPDIVFDNNRSPAQGAGKPHGNVRLDIVLIACSNHAVGCYHDVVAYVDTATSVNHGKGVQLRMLANCYRFVVCPDDHIVLYFRVSGDGYQLRSVYLGGLVDVIAVAVTACRLPRVAPVPGGEGLPYLALSLLLPARCRKRLPLV